MPDRPIQETHFIPLLRQLGVRVEAPYSVFFEGEVVTVAAFLPDFGGRNGMVIDIGDMLDFDKLSRVTDANGIYLSCLNPVADTSEASVRDALNDWGYFGPAARRPSWYTGQAWGA